MSTANKKASVVGPTTPCGSSIDFFFLSSKKKQKEAKKKKKCEKSE
jgi:hypothetical protein